MIKCENACPRGKFDGCCHKCPDFHTCPDSCQENPNACGSATFDEETALQEFKNTQLATLNAIASLTAHKKAIEEQEKEMKAKLYEAMVKFGVDKFESDVLNLTLVKPTNGHITECYIYMNAHYFTRRECISFNRDGWIGFAGWADDGNTNPLRHAFLAWCDYLAEGGGADGKG